MSRAPNPSRTLLLASLIPVLLATFACVDAPFARVNPNDEAVPLTMSLTGGDDTVFTVGQELVFQLVTDPVVTGYPPVWESSAPFYIASQGDGAFVVNNLPAAGEFNVTIRASFRTRSAQQVVRVLSAPP